MTATALRCRVCENEVPPRLAEICARCDGPLDVTYDLPAIRNARRELTEAGPDSMWRYRSLLPVHGDGDGLAAGWTPLVPALRLSRLLEIELWLKLEGSNPTRSFKDRIASVAGATAAAMGFETLCCSSLGHLGEAVSAECAARGLQSVVLAPINAPAIRSDYGATVLQLSGSYEDCQAIERELADQFEWGFLGGNLEPYASEGAKTISYEIAEQLGWVLPDSIVCPIGSGRLFAKAAQGFAELVALGWSSGRPPKLFGAQPGGCSPVATAFRSNRAVSPVVPRTTVSSLAVGTPAAGDLAIGAAHMSGGGIAAIAESSIEEWRRFLAETTGVTAGRCGGVCMAALIESINSGAIAKGETVVLVISGGAETSAPIQREVINAATPSVIAQLDHLAIGR
jgi:threonine synthase